MIDIKSNVKDYGLIMLLVCKAAALLQPQMLEIEKEKIFKSQRELAEVMEQMRGAQLFHKKMMNLQILTDAGNELADDSDLIFGNKITLLCGDFLAGSACAQLASLR
jgi:hypothetical protein